MVSKCTQFLSAFCLSLFLLDSFGLGGKPLHDDRPTRPPVIYRLCVLICGYR